MTFELIIFVENADEDVLSDDEGSSVQRTKAKTKTLKDQSKCCKLAISGSFVIRFFSVVH